MIAGQGSQVSVPVSSRAAAQCSNKHMIQELVYVRNGIPNWIRLNDSSQIKSETTHLADSQIVIVGPRPP